MIFCSNCKNSPTCMTNLVSATWSSIVSIPSFAVVSRRSETETRKTSLTRLSKHRCYWCFRVKAQSHSMLKIKKKGSNSVGECNVYSKTTRIIDPTSSTFPTLSYSRPSRYPSKLAKNVATFSPTQIDTPSSASTLPSLKSFPLVVRYYLKQFTM